MSSSRIDLDSNVQFQSIALTAMNTQYDSSTTLHDTTTALQVKGSARPDFKDVNLVDKSVDFSIAFLATLLSVGLTLYSAIIYERLKARKRSKRYIVNWFYGNNDALEFFGVGNHNLFDEDEKLFKKYLIGGMKLKLFELYEKISDIHYANESLLSFIDYLIMKQDLLMECKDKYELKRRLYFELKQDLEKLMEYVEEGVVPKIKIKNVKHENASKDR